MRPRVEHGSGCSCCLDLVAHIVAAIVLANIYIYAPRVCVVRVRVYSVRVRERRVCVERGIRALCACVCVCVSAAAARGPCVSGVCVRVCVRARVLLRRVFSVVYCVLLVCGEGRRRGRMAELLETITNSFKLA